MKIYEVRVCGGEYEDSYDERIKAFVSQRKAEHFLAKMKEQMTQEKAQCNICQRCPIAYKNFESEEFAKRAMAENAGYAPCVTHATLAPRKQWKRLG